MSVVIQERASSQPIAVVVRPRYGARPAILVLGVLLLAVYHAALRELVVAWWEDPNYSHGFLIPVFSAFLVWQRRAVLSDTAARGSWLGLPVLVTGVLMFAVGEIGGELFLLRSSLIVVLAGLVLFHL